jgi:hypothetical protein
MGRGRRPVKSPAYRISEIPLINGSGGRSRTKNMDSDDRQTLNLAGLALSQGWDVPDSVRRGIMDVVAEAIGPDSPLRAKLHGATLGVRMTEVGLDSIRVAVAAQVADRDAGDAASQAQFLADLRDAEEQTLERVRHQVANNQALSREDVQALEWLEGDLIAKQLSGDDLNSEEEEILRQREARLRGTTAGTSPSPRPEIEGNASDSSGSPLRSPDAHARAASDNPPSLPQPPRESPYGDSRLGRFLNEQF